MFIYYYCFLLLQDQIRVFTYAVGQTANPNRGIKWMACANRGQILKVYSHWFHCFVKIVHCCIFLKYIYSSSFFGTSSPLQINKILGYIETCNHLNDLFSTLLTDANYIQFFAIIYKSYFDFSSSTLTRKIESLIHTNQTIPQVCMLERGFIQYIDAH